MTLSLYMLQAAVLTALFVFCKAVSLYWRYLGFISQFKAWQKLFEMKDCHLLDEEKFVYGYKFDNEESITEVVQAKIAGLINELGKAGILQIVKLDKTERLIVCFVREALMDSLEAALEEVKKLMKSYDNDFSFIRIWLKKEDDELKKLYEDLEKKHLELQDCSGKLITFFPK